MAAIVNARIILQNILFPNDPLIPATPVNVLDINLTSLELKGLFGGTLKGTDYIIVSIDGVRKVIILVSAFKNP